MPTILIAPEGYHQVRGRHIDLLREAGFDVRFPPRPGLKSERETLEALQGVAAAISGSEPYSEHVLAGLPDLRIISRLGVGVDGVDVDAATRHGIIVAITPAANHEAVAEHTFALLLGLAKSVVRHNTDVRVGTWSWTPTMSIRGKTLGIVGLGRIGRSVARRAAGFRLKLVAFETRPDLAFAQALGIELIDLDTLLGCSDFVTLHVPLLPETRGLINRRSLSLMKPGSMLINTARGGLIVEDDLLDALRSGHLAGAGLDVFAQEPIPTNHPLLKLDNVLASPHMASTDAQAYWDMATMAAQNIIDLRCGRIPESAVINPAVLEKWRW